MFCFAKDCYEEGIYARSNGTFYCYEHYRGLNERLKFNDPIVAKDVRGKPKVGYVLKSLSNAIGKTREYGFTKYKEGGTDNWRNVEVDDIYHALKRHVDSMMDARFNTKSRETVLDSESGMPHAWHAATNLMFIIELLDQEANFLSDKKLGTNE